LCLILKEPRDWKQELVACNNNRDAVDISYVVYDVDRPDAVLAGKSSVAGDAVTRLGSIPFFAAEKRFYRIEWTMPDGTIWRNHYLAGFPPFDLEAYRRWSEQIVNENTP